MPKILFRRDDCAYRVTLDAPPLHILDIPMLRELKEALSSLRPDRHALILEASPGSAFSAGASVQDHAPDRVGEMLETFHECFRLLARTELVTIALVRGPALGGGLELAISCDFVLASENATFGTPEVALGVFPPIACCRLSHQAGPRRALEMILSGDPIDATRAHQWGLVNTLLPESDFDRRAAEWIARLTRHSASSIRLARRAFQLGQQGDFENTLGAIESLYLDQLMKTADAHEGIDAFLEKRAPVWRGH
jgi:cyclohexa-1,5-dienecarbonyl-CoA hydratase